LHELSDEERLQAVKDHANGVGPDGEALDRITYHNAALSLTKDPQIAAKHAIGRDKLKHSEEDRKNRTGWVYEVDLPKLLEKAPELRLTIADSNKLKASHFPTDEELQLWGGSVPADCIIRAHEVKRGPPNEGTPSTKTRVVEFTGVVLRNPMYEAAPSEVRIRIPG
jgi:hypothetical protein